MSEWIISLIQAALKEVFPMSEWLKTIIAGGVDGFLSGGFLLAAHYLQHHLQKRAKWQELMAEHVLQACADLRQKIIGLRDYIDGAPPSVNRQEEILKKLQKIQSFVINGEQFLGKEIVACWVPHYSRMISYNVGLQRDKPPANIWFRLIDEGNLTMDDVAKAIEKKLKLAEVTFMSYKDRKQLVEQHLGQANRDVLKDLEERANRQGGREADL